MNNHSKTESHKYREKINVVAGLGGWVREHGGNSTVYV